MRKSKDGLKLLIACALCTTLITGVVSTPAIAETTNSKVENSINKTSKENDEQSQIEEIRLKWKNDLTGGENINLNNPVVKKKVSSIEADAEKLCSTLNKDENRTYLWDNLKDYKENPARITTMYNNVYTLCMAYNIKGNKFYKSEELKQDIISALEWIYSNAYNENVKTYGNWWDWMIGIPKRLTNIGILMHDELSKEQIDKYFGKALQNFLPKIEPGSKNHTGANLTDVSLIKLLQGAIMNDPAKINEGAQSIELVFKYVDTHDGFYDDGSFLQHGEVAYTGSYGAVLLGGVANILYLVEGTPWYVQSPLKHNVYDWIFNSFSPIMYKGFVMDMVRGRALSRSFLTGFNQGSEIVESFMKLADAANKENGDKIKSLIKQYSTANPQFDFTENFKSINSIGAYYKLVNDNSVAKAEETPKHYALNNMDKTVHKRENYTLGISRSSNRVSKYEFMNKENLRPWFQGDGVTYLYNNNMTQFADDFWPTINPYRLPGTTVNTMTRKDKEGTGPAITYERSLGTWSGGTELGAYGVSGMEINNKNDDLKAHKSWFMFDNEIVALGSGITSKDENEIETIVENRKIKKDGTNKFTVDGENKIPNLEDKDKINGAKWAHLEGNVNGGDIGYYFPQGANVNIIRDHREGRWTDINTTQGNVIPIDPELKQNNFLTMYIDHGNTPENDTYSYVLLPNKDESAVKEYSENPNVEIIKNEKNIQGVRHNKLKMEAANFWADGKATSGIITSSGKASVMVKENDDNTLTIAVSDPTFEQNSINLEIDKKAVEIVSKDDAISNVNLGDNVSFDVNTKNAKGKTFELVVKLNKTTSSILNNIPTINGEDVVLTLGDKWTKELHKLTSEDKEDGDLKEKLQIKDNKIPMDKDGVVTEIGEYPVVFEVEDSNGAKANKTLNVKVDDKLENPGDNSNDTKPEDKPNGNLPNTGIPGGVGALGLGAILSIASGVFLKKKRK